MPSVSVLYIEDNIIGPHLELLRNICEPESKSRPHVTVRYFNKLSIPKGHLDTKVKNIDLLEPASFGLDQDDKQINKTIFIRCQSDDLLSLEHKPFFPTSEFHITIYDGKSELFAKSLLQILREFTWALRIDFPVEANLTAIQIKSKKKGKKLVIEDREYTSSLKELFYKVTGENLSFEFIQNISEKKRIQLVKKICKHLMKLTEFHERVEFQHQTVINYPKEYLIEDLNDVHLTPPELAFSITEYATTFLNNKQKVDFGDPSVGTGVFYAALLQVLSKERISSAIGVDISIPQVEAANRRWKKRGMEVIEDDFLHMDKLPCRSLILANPPYMRHQGIPKIYKHELRQRASVILGMRVSGLSGQYVYFLLLSHQWMAKGAVAAWLIPSEFMQTSYGKAVRYYLRKKVRLLRIHQFGHDDPQFENADVLPCVVVFKKELPTVGQEALFTIGGSLSHPKYSENVNIEELGHEKKWTIPTRKPIKDSKASCRLGDLFSVRRGIATGANDFFILECKEAIELGIPLLALKPVLPKVRNLSDDIIERLDDGYPDVNTKLCVLDSSLSNDEISKKYPRMMDYLKSGIDNGVLNGYIVKNRKLWYKQEQRKPAPFLCTYMGRAHSDKPAIRFIWNKSDAIATNTYLMLYPKPKLLNLMNEQPSISSEIFSMLKAAARDTVEEYSRQHARGLSKIEPRELLEVRLSSVSSIIRKTIDSSLI